MAALSKAEYLKRYLSKDEQPKEERKKKRRRIKPLKDSKLRIIDDDIDFNNHKRNETALEDGLNDDAPTVAEIIDERPRHIQDLEAYRKNSRWKVLGEDEEDEVSAMEYGVIQQDSNRTQAVSVTLNKEKSHQVKKHHDSSDSDTSPPRRRIAKDNKSDQKRERVKDVKPRRHDSDSDNSPPRQMKTIVKPSSTGSNRDNTTSNFLSHKNKHSSRAVHDSDSAVARKSSNKSLQNNRTDLDHSSQKKGPSCYDSESDQSPMRRNKTASDSDQTPPRRKRTAADSDESPPRRMKATSDNDQSPPRKKRHDSDSDVSLPRRPQGKSNPGKSCEEGGSKDSKSFKSVRRSRFDDSSGEVAPKATKTLSGATAGLSSAKDMREEARKLKEKEERSFQNIDEETLGKHAKTVVRDKETGRRRNVKAEEAQNEEEERKKEEQMKKFQQWGKGLKQQAIKNIRLEDQIHEASKPLARYADDKDLDDMLRKEERAEDPMLAFFRTKKKKEEEKSGKKKEKELPTYKGPPPPPNRYNIMPGYRWDGVDRSNGFEKKIFAQQANKKAVQEMAYKWSTEDM